MATAKTDLDSLQKKHTDLLGEVERLRQQAADEEQKLLVRQQVESLKNDNELLEKEKARLAERLETAKQASKSFTASSTPVEQAESATKPVETVVKSDENKE